MPTWGRRGSYVGATSVMIVLVAVGAFTKCSRDLIPPEENNDLAGFRSRFLNRAGRQGIRWRTTEQQPFAEAARLGKPVMVFAGSAASQLARKTDDAVFSNREVWARLNRDFVCLRVDLGTEPEWRGAFLPILRNTEGADPGFVVLFFKPNGQLLTWNGRREWLNVPDFNDFLGTLSEIKEQFDTTPPDQWTQSEDEQHGEVVALREAASMSLPDMDAYFKSLVQPRRFFLWHAGRYRSLLQGGYVGDTRVLLRRDMAGARLDLVDGGFFKIGDGRDPMQVEFDKLAATNAEMLAVLARAYVATREPLFEYWYRRTVECLRDQFVRGSEWSSFVESEVGEDGRSLRNSFSVATVRTRFAGEAKESAARLGLDPTKNPLMAPHLVDPDEWMRSRNLLDRVVVSLKEIANEHPLVTGNDSTLDSAGMVVARTLEAAYLMDDQESIDLALGWARGLREFRAGTDEVNHSTFGRGVNRKWLGDFAAYSDAMLMAFAVTGDEAWLQDGERVLRRAIELFRRERPGEVASLPSAASSVGPLSLDMPSIVDDAAPPALPWFMSVCFRYGAVNGDVELRQLAFDIAQRYSDAANKTPTAFTAFFASAQEVVFSGCIVFPSGTPRQRRSDMFVLPAAASNEDVSPGFAAHYTRTDHRPLSLTTG
jgi:uncharacterized protein YyaL (SSP411 family)